MDDIKKAKSHLTEELHQLRQQLLKLGESYKLDQVHSLSNTQLGNLYKFAVSGTPVSIWACDKNWKIVFWNSGAEELYKSSREEVLGKSFLELFVSDRDREQAIVDLERVFNGEAIQGYVAEDILPDGTTRTIYTTVYPILGEHGSVDLQAEFGLDISEIRKTEQALESAREIGRKLTMEIQHTEIEILELIYEQASKLMDTRNMYIALYDEEKNEVSFGLVMDNGRRVNVDKEPGWGPRKAGEGLTEWVIRTGQPQRPENPAEAYKTFAKHYVGEIPKSWMGIPLIIQRKVIGAIVLINDDEENAYNQHHQDVLQTISDYTAVAIQNARFYQKLTKQIEELEMLKNLGDSLISQLSL